MIIFSNVGKSVARGGVYDMADEGAVAITIRYPMVSASVRLQGLADLDEF